MQKITGQAASSGTLYVVGTPIGNLEDITLRALRILKEVDLIAAEDTRHTRKLLAAYEIEKPLVSYFAQNELKRVPYLIEQLHLGKNIAMVSDAGTPGIADPGYHLLQAAWAEGIRIVPIPGPSSVTAALSVSGLPGERFAFEKFLPPKTGQRRKFFESIIDDTSSTVVFESPHRILAALSDMEAILGDRQIFLGREITKQFEEILKGTPAQLRLALGSKKARGEFTLIITGAEKKRKKVI